MPKTPTIASTSARPANATTSTARKRCAEVASRATSSSVCAEPTLTSCAVSMRPMAARTAGASAAASPVAGRTSRKVSSSPAWVIGTYTCIEVLGLVGPALHLARHADDLAHNRLLLRRVGRRQRHALADRVAATRGAASRTPRSRCRQTGFPAVSPVGERAADDHRQVDRRRSRRRSRSGSPPTAADCRRAARRRRS